MMLGVQPSDHMQAERMIQATQNETMTRDNENFTDLSVLGVSVGSKP